MPVLQPRQLSTFSSVTTALLALTAGVMVTAGAQQPSPPGADIALFNSCSSVVERSTNRTSCLAVIGNRGPDLAANVVYNGHLPNIDKSALPLGCTPGIGDTFTCDAGSLGASQITVLPFWVTRPPRAEFRFSGFVQSPVFDPNPEDNSDQTIHGGQVSARGGFGGMVPPRLLFDLGVQSSVAPEPVVPGEPMFFQFVVMNRGGQDATGVTVVHPVAGFDARFRITEVSSNVPGADCLMHHGREPFAVLPVPTPPIDKANAVCTVGDLPAGASAMFTFRLEPEAPGGQRFASGSGAFAVAPDFLIPNNNSGSVVPQFLCGDPGTPADVPNRLLDNPDIGWGATIVRGGGTAVGFEFAGKRQQDLVTVFTALDGVLVLPTDAPVAGLTGAAKQGTPSGKTQIFSNVQANDPRVVYGTSGAGDCVGFIGLIFDLEGNVSEIRVSHMTGDESARDVIGAMGDFPPGSQIVAFGGDDSKEESRLLMEGVLNALGSFDKQQIVIRFHTGDTLFVDNQGMYYTRPALDRAPTSTTLTSSLNPSKFGEAVTLIATVTSASATPTGVVVFREGGTVIGEAPLDAAGQARLMVPNLRVGSHPITADYPGDGDDFSGSVSPPVNQVVSPADTSTSLMSTPNPSAFGEPVSFAATVVSPGGTPSGMVSFSSGSTALGTAALDGMGTASFSLSTLSVGTHPVLAAYLGDASFNGSSSAIVAQVVEKAATVTTLQSSPNPSTFGQPVGFIVTVTAAGGTPTGALTVFVDGTPTRTALLSNGSASFTDASLSIGTHEIAVQYTGDANFNVSTSNVVTQTVIAPMLEMLLSQ